MTGIELSLHMLTYTSDGWRCQNTSGNGTGSSPGHANPSSGHANTSSNYRNTCADYGNSHSDYANARSNCANPRESRGEPTCYHYVLLLTWHYIGRLPDIEDSSTNCLAQRPQAGMAAVPTLPSRVSRALARVYYKRLLSGLTATSPLLLASSG